MGNAAARGMHHDYHARAAAAATGGRRRKRCSKNTEAANVPASGRRGAEHSAAATGVTVKVVLRRKDAERLIARLNEQSAMGRKARMAEIKSELMAGDGGRGAATASASPARCRDAWTHRLAPIQEN
uniref:Uncharacterized protein n=1 Tax=Oryza meridionalis TaxID=40149 RepID=A0A0E0C651_9ORYZ